MISAFALALAGPLLSTSMPIPYPTVDITVNSPVSIISTIEGRFGWDCGVVTDSGTAFDGSEWVNFEPSLADCGDIIVVRDGDVYIIETVELESDSKTVVEE